MKLFRKLTVLTLAVLLIAALSASALAISWDTQCVEYDDLNTITSHVEITVNSIYGEINRFIEVPISDYYEISFDTKRIFHSDGHTQFITECYQEDGDELMDQYSVTINATSGMFYFTQVSCDFYARVTNWEREFNYVKTSATVYP